MEHDGASTRELLLTTAERLFAERGLNGVSLREIGAAAGQRNTGAVRYHFGSKDALVEAIFRHRMEPINEERVAVLAELDAQGHGDDMRGLAEATLYPYSSALGEIGRPTWYMRFCVQAGSTIGASTLDLGRHPWTHGMHVVKHRFDDALERAGVTRDLHEDRWTRFAGHFAHSLADREHLLQHMPRRVRTPRGVFLSDLVDTGVALAAAPVSTETSRHLRSRRSA